VRAEKLRAREEYMEQETVQQVLASTSWRARGEKALAPITLRASKPKRLNLRVFDAALDEMAIRS